MKKKYTEVDMEIIEFETEDVITASGGDDQPNRYEYIMDGAFDSLVTL